MIFDAFVKTEELLFLCDPTYLLKEDCFLIMTINFLNDLRHCMCPFKNNKMYYTKRGHSLITSS